MNESNDSSGTSVTLKWSKQIFKEQFRLFDGSTALEFKEQVQNVTGVSVKRQKLLCKGFWKGTLRDDVVFSREALPQGPITVTLIGSAEELPEPPKEKTKFLEDLTTDELLAQEEAEKAEALANSEGMIVALQLPPHLRDDNKTEMYQYNRLVTGLPQREIEDMLRSRRDSSLKEEQNNNNNEQLLGKVVMTLGIELRRAYVNDLAVLMDGTLVSGLDDGHVQMWRYGALVNDFIHDGMIDGGVDCVATLGSLGNQQGIAFATGGRGCVRLWTAEGQCVRMMPSPAGTSPSSLVAIQLTRDTVCLAASFRVVRQSDPSQIRLVPQDEEGRQRRAQAEAQEAAIQEGLSRVTRCVQIWHTKRESEMRSAILEPEDIAGSAPVTDLAFLHNRDDQERGTLVCGDAAGGLRLWQAQCSNDGDVQLQFVKLFQLYTSDPTHAASVVCMEPIPDGRLAVSTEGRAGYNGAQELSGSHPINIPLVRAVFLFDTRHGVLTNAFNAHTDVVQCMCSLPNGGFITGGGKYDATLKVWDTSQLKSNYETQEQHNENGPALAIVTSITGVEGSRIRACHDSIA